LGMTGMVLGLYFLSWVLATSTIINPEFTGVRYLVQLLKNLSNVAVLVIFLLVAIGGGAYLMWHSLRDVPHGRE